MRVLLTGGGTAGHINPALAIAEIIRANDASAVIEFVGTRTGKENDLVLREGYRLHHVRTMGIQRSLSLSNIKALWLALTSPYAGETVNLIKDFKPDLVIGTGGYVCWPLMAAAARMKIPTAVHESNAIPGLAVKKLQNKIDRVWINFEGTREKLDRRAHVVRVGNPLRGGFGAVSYEAAREKLGIGKGQKLILSFGGSLGAEEVTNAVLDMMQTVVAKNETLIHVHATGKRDYDAARARFEAMGLASCAGCQLVDYIYDMPLYMSAADLVISRAGAMTLSELARLGKACILIPSPNVVDNHQYKNAKMIADADGAILVEEKDLASGELNEAASFLLHNGEAISELKKNIAAFADVDANRMIWMEILQLLKKA